MNQNIAWQSRQFYDVVHKTRSGCGQELFLKKANRAGDSITGVGISPTAVGFLQNYRWTKQLENTIFSINQKNKKRSE